MSHCMCWKVPSSILVEDQDATLKAFFRLNIQFVLAILRVTGAADMVDLVIEANDAAFGIPV